jgi:hypothetical protein
MFRGVPARRDAAKREIQAQVLARWEIAPRETIEGWGIHRG